ncbi:MAG TPA: hypothetical protein VGP72_08410 [Planctomycetota bacterium]|jgi:hypothetical protein
MSDALEGYRQLQDKLSWVRWTHLGHDSDEEDAVLDEMDGVWWSLSEEERRSISAEPPRADLIQGEQKTTSVVDVDISRHPGAVRRYVAA